MNEDFETALNGLKELILTKFDELEKREQIRDENNRLKFEAITAKNNEQDIRIKNIEDKQINTWEKIKTSAINWIIPAMLVACAFYIRYGKK